MVMVPSGNVHKLMKFVLLIECSLVWQVKAEEMSLDVTLEEVSPSVEEDSEDEIFWGPVTMKEEVKASKIRDRKTMLLVSGPLYRRYSDIEAGALGRTASRKGAMLDQGDTIQNNHSMKKKTEHLELAVGECETVPEEEFIDSELNKLRINDSDEKVKGSIDATAEGTSEYSCAVESYSQTTTVSSEEHSDSSHVERNWTKTDVTMKSGDTSYNGIKSTQSCESPYKALNNESEGNVSNLGVGKELAQVKGSDTNVASQSRENFRKHLVAHNLVSLYSNESEMCESTPNIPATNQEDVQVVTLEENSVSRHGGCDMDATPQDSLSASAEAEVIFDHPISELSSYRKVSGTLINTGVDVVEKSVTDTKCDEENVEASFNESLECQSNLIEGNNCVVVSCENSPVSLKSKCPVDRNDINRFSNNNLDQESSCHVENVSVSSDILEENEMRDENPANSSRCSENFHFSRSTIDSSTGAICSESLHSSDLKTNSFETDIHTNGCSREIAESEEAGQSSIDALDFSSYSHEKCNAMEEDASEDNSTKGDFADCREIQENGTDGMNLPEVQDHFLIKVSAGENDSETDRSSGKVDYKNISELSVVETEHEEGNVIPQNLHSGVIGSQSNIGSGSGLLPANQEDAQVSCPSSLNSSFPAPETSKSFKQRNELLAKTRLGTRESYYSSLPLIDIDDDKIYGCLLMDDSGLCHSGVQSQSESLEDNLGSDATCSRSVGLYTKENGCDLSLTAPISTSKLDTREQCEVSGHGSAVVTNMPSVINDVSEGSLEKTSPLHQSVPERSQKELELVTFPTTLQTASQSPDDPLPSITEHSYVSSENSRTSLVLHEQQSLESSGESYGSVNKGMVITHSLEEIHENYENYLNKEEDKLDSEFLNSIETAAYLSAVDQVCSPSSQVKSGLASYHTAVESMNSTVSSVESEGSPKRHFNDTIEEMEMLLKYGLDYEEKMEYGASEDNGEKSGNLDDTDDDPIVSPLRKTSVCSTVSNISFKPMMDSTRASSYKEEQEKPSIYVHNVEKEPVKIYSPERETAIVNETKKAQSKAPVNLKTCKQDGEEGSIECRVAPPKPPRLKGSEPTTPVRTENKDRGSTSSSVQSSRSPTPNLNKMRTKDYSCKKGPAKRNQTPSVTPVKVKMLTSNLVSKGTPSSNNATPSRGTKTLNANSLSEKFLTPQCKASHTVQSTGSVGRLQYRKLVSSTKKQGLSIVSPVARYLKENPPPPLVRNVKPKHKLNPLKMNHEKEVTTVGTNGSSPAKPIYAVSQEELRSPANNPESGRTAQKKILTGDHKAILDKIDHNMAKLHDKIEEGQLSKSRHGKGSTSVLPVCSYSAATPVQYDDEKENRRIRRDVLGEKPAKRVVKHKGRMNLPKVNFVEGLESASPNSTPAKIKLEASSTNSSERDSLVEVSLYEPHQVRHTNTLCGALKTSFE
ncbi:uncharacterized protein LOC143037265 isoform X2 [Oratosquilla oratoria]|uniref:uncharacterized protein LOC143037265 isoform X2 n=1 Tax=Oratosquilla oratoria TaxID=337810 RepID=UPI003F7642F0